MPAQLTVVNDIKPMANDLPAGCERSPGSTDALPRAVIFSLASHSAVGYNTLRFGERRPNRSRRTSFLDIVGMGKGYAGGGLRVVCL